jgi:hypothetical protein
MKEALIDRGPSKMKRKEDCPAIEVCGKIKNVRRLCEKGGTYSSRDIDVCVVSMVLLLDRLIEKLGK